MTLRKTQKPALEALTTMIRRSGEILLAFLKKGETPNRGSPP